MQYILQPSLAAAKRELTAIGALCFKNQAKDHRCGQLVLGSHALGLQIAAGYQETRIVPLRHNLAHPFLLRYKWIVAGQHALSLYELQPQFLPVINIPVAEETRLLDNLLLQARSLRFCTCCNDLLM